MKRLVLAFCLLFLASACAAAPGNRLRLTYIPAPSPFPATQTVNFGQKTLVGYGGSPMNYASPQLLGISRWVAITSVTDANSNVICASVSTCLAASGPFQIDDRQMLVPKNGATAYGGGWGAPAAGPYTVVACEYRDAAHVAPTGSCTQVTVPILPNIYHAREMTSAARGCTVDCAVTNPDGGTGTFSSFKHQLAGILGAATASTACKGDMIYLRNAGPGADGSGKFSPFNPITDSTHGYKIKPLAGAYACGSGRITIQSETVDLVTTDAYGPALKHGFQTGGNIQLDLSLINTDVPFDFQYIWCYAGQNSYNGYACLSHSTTTAVGGESLTYSRCEGISNESVFTSGMACLSANGHPNVKFSNNHSHLAGKSATSGGNAVIENNICEQSRNDCFDIQAANNTVRYNICIDWHSIQPNHSDCLQRIALNNGQTYSGNVIDYNISVLGDVSFLAAQPGGGCTSTGCAEAPQCWFMRSTTNGETDVGAEIKDNLCYTMSQNALYLSHFNAPVISGMGALLALNTGLTLPALQPAFVVKSTEAGVGLTLTGSTFNNYLYSGQTPPYTLNPNPPNQLAATALAYGTALPSLVLSGAPGYKSRAQVIAQIVPANLLTTSGGLKNSDGTFNWPVLPANNSGDVCWNQPGLVFDATKTCAQMGTTKAQ